MQEPEFKKRLKRDFDIFKRNFLWAENKKIVLYGTGKNTAYVLSENKNFNIVGLCDRDDLLVGEEMYGKRILSQTEAEANADIVIICTSQSFWKTIYRRIRNWEIPIYYMNGERGSDEDEYDLSEDTYWQKSLTELQAVIDNYDIISFDVYDTLLMRKVCDSDDVLRIVQNKNKEFELYYQYRVQAAKLNNYLDLNEIYEEIHRCSGWDYTDIIHLKQDEVETDLAVTVPRSTMVKLANEVKKTKEVFVISDMYYTPKQLEEILFFNGLDISEDHILVSCDKRRGKGDGSLWSLYKQSYVGKRRAIHIGDNYDKDYACPVKEGIQAYHIRSTWSMLENSSLRDVSFASTTLHSSLVLGSLLAKMFDDPFRLCKLKGRLSFDSREEMGYVLLGAIFESFVAWLAKECEKDKIDNLCFFGRDGYFLCKAYNHYIDKKGCNKLYGQYLDISRRAAMIAAISSDEDIIECFSYPFDGTIQELFQERFRVSYDEPRWNNVKYHEIQKERKLIREIVNSYVDEIKVEAQKERENYMIYIKNNNLEGKLGVVDMWLYGTTQHYFSKIIQKETVGYYMYVADENRYSKENIMKGFFGCSLNDIKNTPIGKYSTFLEAFCTAPSGMLVCMGEEGKPIYTGISRNQVHFSIREEMFQGILKFIDDKQELFGAVELNGIVSDKAFIQQLFKCLMEDGFYVDDEMRRSFYYDNALSTNRETQIW